MLIICEGMDKCGKSTFLKNLGILVYEANKPWGADITKQLDYNKYKPIKTIDYLYNFRHLLNNKNIGIHLGPDDEKPYETAIKCIEISKVCNLYLDRSWISEQCYGPVYRNNSRLNPIDEQIILKELKLIPHQILWFTCDINHNYFSRLDSSNMFECDKEKVIATATNYSHIMGIYGRTVNIMTIEMMK